MKAFIDHIKDECAIIHIEDDEVELEIPRRLLPPGSREGSWLNIYFELDPDGTKKQDEKILKQLEKMKRKR